MDALRKSLRDLVLEELRIDQGWSEYIDLLLDSIDTKALAYTQSNGLQYKLAFSAYKNLCISYGDDAARLAAYGTLPPVYVVHDSVSGSTFYVVNPAHAAGTEVASLYYDFGDGSVCSTQQLVQYGTVSSGAVISHEGYFDQCLFYIPEVQPFVCSVEGVLSLWNDYRAGWTRSIQLSGGTGTPLSFIVQVYDNIHTAEGVLLSSASVDTVSGAIVYSSVLTDATAGMLLQTVPTTLNGAAIRGARGLSGVGVHTYGSWPCSAGLWDIVSGFGVSNTSATPYRFYLYSGISEGVTTVDYDGAAGTGYVEYRGSVDPTLSPAGGNNYIGAGSTASVVGLVSSEATIVSPLWDTWGPVGSRALIGYDKKYWVVNSNRLDSDIDITYLGVLSASDTTWGSQYPTPAAFTVLPSSVYIGGNAAVEGVSVCEVQSSVAWTLASVDTTSGAVATSPLVSYPTDMVYAQGSTHLYLATPDGRLLITPDSVTGVEDYGLVKDYHTMSIQSGVLDTVVLAYGCSKDALGVFLYESGLIDVSPTDVSFTSAVDSFVAELRSALLRSVPVGIDVKVLFGYTPVVVGLGLSAGRDTDVSLALAVTPTAWSVGVGGSSTSGTVSGNTIWQVSGEVGPYIRVSVSGGAWSSSGSVSLGGYSEGVVSVSIDTNQNIVIS